MKVAGVERTIYSEPLPQMTYLSVTDKHGVKRELVLPKWFTDKTDCVVYFTQYGYTEIGQVRDAKEPEDL